MRKLCIAGRGSRLATVQNERIRSLLEEQGFEVNILTVSTRGDRDRKSSVTELGGDGPFVRDVEKAVLSGQADLAVHCVKDLPYETAPGLCIAGVPDAADPRDCLIMRRGTDAGFDRRPLIGTGSPRRIRQLDELLERETGFRGEYLGIRGNITTRLEKLRKGECDGIVLAKAGLDRIGADLSDLQVRILTPQEMIPAVGQGMLACECRESDTELRELLDRITPARNYIRYRIEREIFCRFRCDCRTPVGIYAEVGGQSAELHIMYGER